MAKIIIALLLALSIGAACRYFNVPVPAPPKLLGALLILAITVGYLGADAILAPDRAPAPTAAGAKDALEPESHRAHEQR